MAVKENRAELIEHLAELRNRIIRALIYSLIGASAAWFLYDIWLFPALTHPMLAVMKERGFSFLLTGFPEAFLIKMQICIISGLIIMSPFVTLEIWGFISPGLTRDEKRPLMWLAPLAVVLFIAGVALCYMILPKAFEWFASFIPRNAELKPAVQTSILFTVKMLFAFGVVFELPVILTLLAKVGIVDSAMLKANWRAAMVIVSIAAALITPSNDAFTMMMMATPVALLYFGSIGLVWAVEGKRKKR